MEVLEKFIAILKLPLKFIFTLAVVLGLVLFLPTTMIEKLKIDSFIELLWRIYRNNILNISRLPVR